MTIDINMIKEFYSNLEEKISKGRNIVKRPLTLAEKILWAHMVETPEEAPTRGETYVNLAPDRVAMQDATAQMALLQFMLAGKKTVAVPSSVHCDHLILAENGSEKDLARANIQNKEIYDFLSSVSKKYGIGFWGPGSGIIHQIILENYAFPGGMLIGTDSHTPNAGGLGTLSIGVGGADAVDVMTGMPWELKWPKLIGVQLKGKLPAWSSPKDIILKLAGLLTVKGGTGCIIEYFGEGTQGISTTGKATVTNMGAEVGATNSIFPFDEKAHAYLAATGRKDVAEFAKANQKNLEADPEVMEKPDQYYDQVIVIDLSALEPHLVGPFTPDLSRAISSFKEEVKEKNYPQELKSALIGSCTNSSYEDLARSASLAKQALDKGMKAKSDYFVSPGSEQIAQTTRRDGILDILEEFGGVILSNSCGPCIGQWQRLDHKEETPNSIVTSFNRNFKARNDGNPATLAFISSPELVTALAIAGKIDFNPETDEISLPNGEKFKLTPPQGDELPKEGYVEALSHYVAPSDQNQDQEIIIDPQSDRLQELTPFSPWDQKDEIIDAIPLVKAKGKCTTDHISPAGKWLKYRGHLDNISDNAYIGAINAFTGDAGTGKNLLNEESKVSFSQIARDYNKQNIPWVVIGDENYGEGSSREHAAMEPRHLGCKAVITKSIARIAENNLKKQGVLAASFANPEDYELVQETDKLTIKGLKDFAPGSSLTLLIKHKDGTEDEIKLVHTYSEYQIEWFKAGSALNLIRSSQS